MKVKDVMARDVATVAPYTTLAEAAWKMWEKDCGVLPIVSGGKVVGVITDRDIAMAVGTNDRSAREIKVEDVSAQEVHACHIDDDVETALEIMECEQVRRLPAVDDDEALRGIISMNDLLLMTGNGKGLSSETVLSSCREISRHRRKPEAPQVTQSPAKKAGSLPEGARRA